LLLVLFSLSACLDPSEYDVEPDAGEADTAQFQDLLRLDFGSGFDLARFDTGTPPIDINQSDSEAPDPDEGLEVDKAIPELDQAPPPTHCRVLFQVQVPAESAGEIYLTGDMLDWEPDAQVLSRSGNEASVTLELELGPIEYKYTRGSWESVEVTSECAESANRPLNIRCGPDGEAPPVIDQVPRWQDGC